MSTRTLTAIVHATRREADGVISVELRPARRDVSFPAFTAGAHIDLHLPDGLIRSYSLCNSQNDSQRYVIAVLRDRSSRGGSRYVHENLRVGDLIEISAPRNNFPLGESAQRFVLVAGGIGITPILAMLRRLRDLGRQVKLLYCARTRSEAAFLAELARIADDGVPVEWHFDDERGVPNLTDYLAGDSAEASYYCCGPEPMLNAFLQVCESLGYSNAFIERFAAAPTDKAGMMERYVVELRRSGRTLEVSPARSLLDTLLDAGYEPDYGCKEGVCGACEVRVLDGAIDHRDNLLSKAQKAGNKTMLICVSGCKSGKLVLDM